MFLLSAYFSQLRKLAVLLDMDDGLERLLELAADTETLQDSLADVDLSAADEGEEQEEEGDTTAGAASKEGRNSISSGHSAASVLMSPSAAAAACSSGQDVKAMAKGTPTFRNTSWDKEDAGNEDTTEVSLRRLRLCLLERCQPSVTICATRHLILPFQLFRQTKIVGLEVRPRHVFPPVLGAFLFLALPFDTPPPLVVDKARHNSSRSFLRPEFSWFVSDVAVAKYRSRTCPGNTEYMFPFFYPSPSPPPLPAVFATLRVLSR